MERQLRRQCVPAQSIYQLLQLSVNTPWLKPTRVARFMKQFGGRDGKLFGQRGIRTHECVQKCCLRIVTIKGVVVHSPRLNPLP